MRIRTIFSKLVLIAFIITAIKSNNTIDEIFFHQGVLEDKLVCYNKQKPTLENIVSKHKTRKRLHCVLQNTGLSPVAQERLAVINSRFKKASKQPYRIAGTTSTKNTTFTITYNPEQVAITEQKFTSIKGEHGIVFTVTHKDVLEQLKKGTSRLSFLAAYNSSPTIVIDCGHGGHDIGAQGKHESKEKEITLAIGTKAAALLRSKGFRVFLTRRSDIFVPLDERTSMANLIAYADAFISIHANSAANKDAQGLETYYLEQKLLTSLHTSEDSISPLYKNIKQRLAEQSILLAQYIHTSTLKTARTKNPLLKDRGVRSSVSQVLLGSEAPSALVEVDFVSNSAAAKLLMDTSYQELIARGITKGLIAYFNKNSKATLKHA